MEMDRQKMKVKVCLVGEGAVGKTCLIRRFIQDQFDDRYISTLGAKVSKKEIKVDGPSGGMDVDMTIWDIMGERIPRAPEGSLLPWSPGRPRRLRCHPKG